MKKTFALCLLLSAFCLLSISLFAQKQKPAYQSKVFTKSFIVNAKDLLEVNTRYADVVFQTWDKNEVVFTTTISINSGTEKDLENLLNCTDIITNQMQKKISFKLTLDCSGKKVNNFNIDIVIKMPQDIFLETTSSYGDTKITNLRNDFNAEISYGDLNIENLLGNNNTVKVRYGDFNLEQAKNIALDIQYSDVKMKEISGTLHFNSRFNTIKIDKAYSIDLSSAYDDISIRNSIDKIEGKMEYGKLKIRSLKSSCIFNKFSYSDININEVLPSFTHITLLSVHSNLTLNVPIDQSFAFEYFGKFTNFKDQNIKLNDAAFEAGSNTLELSGFYGKNQTSGKKIKISASFGTVSLFE
ncbi:MAG: DUF4097 domain-containing protein [Lentimicrobiaceae bacterium]|nr:DUF4097 domain-containing protein [Lentimicrobiaceae bacterium]